MTGVTGVTGDGGRETLYQRLVSCLATAARLHQERADLLKARPGGSSIATVERAERVAERAAALAREARRAAALTARRDSPAPLSPRELAVVEMMARGLRDREIAAKLGMSTRTVESHAVHIYRKLGTRGRTEVVAWYLRTQATAGHTVRR